LPDGVARWRRGQDGNVVERHDFDESAHREVDEWAQRGGPTAVRLWPERTLAAEEQRERVLIDQDGRCFELVVASNLFAVPLLANATQRECGEVMPAEAIYPEAPELWGGDGACTRSDSG
jgi:hypothetical protein